MITIQTLSILKVNVLEKAHFAFVRMVDSNAPSLLTIGSTGSLLDKASQLLECRLRARLVVLGSNARRNVLE
jgi:hypothetical protein